MKLAILVVLAQLIASTSAYSSPSSSHPKIIPVEGFKAERYLGRWYEIGSIPMRFARDCTCTQATYTQRDGGKLGVLNECWRKSPQGKYTKVNGSARFAGSPDVGKLLVRFFLWFDGDYWVTELGQDYDYSVVSNPEGSTLLVLSRERTMPKDKLDGILDRAREKGIQVDRFQMQVQESCQEAM